MRNGDRILKIRADILAIPTLVFRNKVGKSSPVYNTASSMQDVAKKRPAKAQTIPAVSFTKNKSARYYCFIPYSTA